MSNKNKVQSNINILLEDELAIRDFATKSGCSISNIINILVFYALENMSGDDLSSLEFSQLSKKIFFPVSDYKSCGRNKKILSFSIDRNQYNRLCHLCYLYSLSFSVCINILIRYSLEKLSFAFPYTFYLM